jgi:hypothetical protein
VGALPLFSAIAPRLTARITIMIISRYVGFESRVDRLDSNVDFSLDSPDAVV